MATHANAYRNSSDENSKERSNASSGSNDTLGNNQKNEGDDSERRPDGGENGNGSDTPPQPVGFWDKKLRKARLQIYGLWARTSETPREQGKTMRTMTEIVYSADSFGLHLGRFITLLGCSLQGPTKSTLSRDLRGRF